MYARANMQFIFASLLAYGIEQDRIILCERSLVK